MNPFSYARPSSVEEAIGQFRPDSRYIAGGTNLLDLMKENVTRPSQLIDITQLPLADIEETPEGGLRIGALVSNADLAWHPLVEARYPLLSQAILAGASPQSTRVSSMSPRSRSSSTFATLSQNETSTDSFKAEFWRLKAKLIRRAATAPPKNIG